jgi:hypothetical protein
MIKMIVFIVFRQKERERERREKKQKSKNKKSKIFSPQKKSRK